EHLKILAEIQQIAGGPGDRARMLRERLSVKKYMCGNGALALGIAGIVLGVWLLSERLFRYTLGVLLMLSILALGLGQKNTLRKQTHWEDSVRNRAGDCLSITRHGFRNALSGLRKGAKWKF